MARMVRCGLIQARNVLGAEHSLAEIRDAMVKKHVDLIEQAARHRCKSCACRNCFTDRIFVPSRIPAGTNWLSLYLTVPPSA